MHDRIRHPGSNTPNHSNHARNRWPAVPLAAALVALVGGLLLAAGPLGCGTDDFNTGGRVQDANDRRDTEREAVSDRDNTPSGTDRGGEGVAGALTEGAPNTPNTPNTANNANTPNIPPTTGTPNPSPDAGKTRSLEAQGATAGARVEPVKVPSYEEAEALYHRGEYDQAIAGFAAHADEHPRSAWGHYMLGLAHWKRAEYVAAGDALREAARLRPDMTKAHLNLARVWLDAGRPQAAHEAAQRAVVLEPDNADAQRVLARALHNLGLADRALEVYRRVLALRPDDAWAMNNMGLILIEEERFLEAVGPLATATGASPAQAVFHNNLGVALERLGHPDEAAEAYRQTLAIDSTYVRAAVSLDRVLPLAAASEAPALDLARHIGRFEQQVAGWRAEMRPGATTAAVDR